MQDNLDKEKKITGPDEDQQAERGGSSTPGVSHIPRSSDSFQSVGHGGGAYGPEGKSTPVESPSSRHLSGVPDMKDVPVVLSHLRAEVAELRGHCERQADLIMTMNNRVANIENEHEAWRMASEEDGPQEYIIASERNTPREVDESAVEDEWWGASTAAKASAGVGQEGDQEGKHEWQNPFGAGQAQAAGIPQVLAPPGESAAAPPSVPAWCADLRGAADHGLHPPPTLGYTGVWPPSTAPHGVFAGAEVPKVAIGTNMQVQQLQGPAYEVPALGHTDSRVEAAGGMLGVPSVNFVARAAEQDKDVFQYLGNGPTSQSGPTASSTLTGTGTVDPPPGFSMRGAEPVSYTHLTLTTNREV